MDSGISVTLKLRGMFFWTASTTWWSLPGNISERQMEARGKRCVNHYYNTKKILHLVKHRTKSKCCNFSVTSDSFRDKSKKGKGNKDPAEMVKFSKVLCPVCIHKHINTCKYICIYTSVQRFGVFFQEMSNYI